MVSIDLTTTATVSASTALTIVVYEDVGNDGAGASTDSTGKAFDNSASQSIGNGTNTYTLTGFTGGSGNAYWIRVNPSNSNVTSTAKLNAASLDVPAVLTGTAAVSASASASDMSGVTAGTADTAVTASASVVVTTEAVSEATTATSGASGFPVIATTDLPDAQAPTLGNGVEDEISISWTDVVNYGEYDTEYRETSATSWLTGPSEGEATTSTIIPNLEDGEEYEVRMRTQTEHVTGAWTTPVSIITKFPGVTGLTMGTVTQTSAPLSWTDNSDNEDGQEIQRSEQLEDGSWEEWLVLDDVGPNATTYTDSTLLPGHTYRWRVRAYTEHIEHHSQPVTDTTVSSTLPTQPVESTGWYLEVDHSSGATHTPMIVGEPTRRPRLNGLPEAVVSVARSQKWDENGFNRATVRLWKDGKRQPLDTLTKHEQAPGETRLTLRGGSELMGRVERDVTNENVHTLAGDLVTTNTSYLANVDDPNAGTQQDTLVQEGDTTTELEGNIIAGGAQTDPVTISGGELSLAQTCWTFDMDSYLWTLARLNAAGSGDQDSNTGNLTGISSGTSTTDSMTLRFTTAYDIPAGDLRVDWRTATEGGEEQGDAAYTHPGFRVLVDGVEVTSFVDDWGSYQHQFEWQQVFSSGAPALSAGDHTIEFDSTQAGDASIHDELYVDLVSVADGRFSYNYDNDNGNPYTTDTASYPNAYLDSPQPYPDAHTVTFEDATPTFSVTGGRIDVALNDTTGAQALGLSNDQGATWSSAANTATFDQDFLEQSSTLRSRVTLSRFGSTTGSTPLTGVNPQVVSSYQLYADLDQTPFISTRAIDGSLEAELASLAETHDYIWEVQYDDGFTVEWTRAGQRTSTATPGVVDYSVERDASSINRKAIVYGSSQRIRGESFVSSFGTPVALDQDYIQSGSEVVYDSNGTQYTANDDYTLQENAGTITVLAGGTMTDATSYTIDYAYRTRGEYVSSAYAGSAEEEYITTIPQLTRDTDAEQAAYTIVRKTSTPVVRASVTIDKEPIGFSLVDALTIPDLPGVTDPLAVWNVSESPRTIQLTLGNRERVEEIVSGITSRLAGTAQQT